MSMFTYTPKKYLRLLLAGLFTSYVSGYFLYTDNKLQSAIFGDALYPILYMLGVLASILVMFSFVMLVLTISKMEKGKQKRNYFVGIISGVAILIILQNII